MFFYAISGASKSLIAKNLGSDSLLDQRLRELSGGVAQSANESGQPRGSDIFADVANIPPGSTHHDGELDNRKKQMIDALDEFQKVVESVLDSRQADEDRARKLIVGIGICVLLVVLFSLIWQVVNSDQQIVTTLLTGAGAAALMFVAYSPVPRIIQIANDRSYLMALPTSLKVRVLSASSVEDLAHIGRELQQLLEKIRTPE